MKGSTHAIVGAAAGLWLGYMTTQRVDGALLGTLGGALGGLLPDIDHARSKLGRRAYLVSRTIQFTLGHRTFTHGVFFLLGLFAVTMISGNVVAYTTLFGATLHVVCDMTTPRGVPFFYPLTNVNFRIPLLWRFSAVTETLTLACSLFLLLGFALRH